jgi:chromosome segregation ATPase
MMIIGASLPGALNATQPLEQRDPMSLPQVPIIINGCKANDSRDSEKILGLEKSVADLNIKLKASRKRVQDRNAELRNLRRQLDEMEEQLRDTRASLEEANSALENVTQQLEEAQEQAREDEDSIRNLRTERDQFRTWWLNEVDFSHSLLNQIPERVANALANSQRGHPHRWANGTRNGHR